MSQVKAARALGLSQAVLSKIESGLREPTAEEMARFAGLYEKTIQFFFDPSHGSVSEKLEKYFAKNARHHRIDMAFLYGSFARGWPRADSDVDIGLVFNSGHGASAQGIYNSIADISLDLATILKCEVSIVAVDPRAWLPMLYYNIIVLGRPVYRSDDIALARFKGEAIMQMEDFKVMGEGFQIAAAKAAFARAKDAEI